MRDYKPTLLRLYAVLAGLFLASLPEAPAQTLLIDSTTANWVEGFTDFVRWQTEEDLRETRIAVIGDSEVARYLERRAAVRKSKPLISVVELHPNEPFDGVDIVFVGSGQQQHWPTIFEKCKGREILTIGEQEGFCESGGSVEFFVRRNNLSFYIHEENLRASGVEIKSQLYALAKERDP